MDRFRVGDVAPTLFLWNGWPVKLRPRRPKCRPRSAADALGQPESAAEEAMPVDGNKNGIERGVFLRRLCLGGTP